MSGKRIERDKININDIKILPIHNSSLKIFVGGV